MNEHAHYKLIFFVPESYVESVKAAVFKAGAGEQGDYDSCAWQCLGTGQFRPGAGADPYLGSAGEIERVSEYRVETLVAAQAMSAVIRALRMAHPYEEPAFEILPLVSERHFEA